MKEFFQKMLRNKIIMAVISIIFGIILIVYQGGAVATILRILGVLVLVGAVIGLISYFANGANKDNPSVLASAILGFIFGIILVTAPGWLIAIFPIVMGLVLIINSIYNISALLSAPIKTGMFGFGLILSILSLILGIMAITRPGAVANAIILFIGITYLINGLTDLIAIASLRHE